MQSQWLIKDTKMTIRMRISLIIKTQMRGTQAYKMKDHKLMFNLITPQKIHQAKIRTQWVFVIQYQCWVMQLDLELYQANSKMKMILRRSNKSPQMLKNHHMNNLKIIVTSLHFKIQQRVVLVKNSKELIQEGVIWEYLYYQVMSIQEKLIQVEELLQDLLIAIGQGLTQVITW